MISIVLFAVGMIPMYVSAIIVEKYYTAFWTGFWNLYGIAVNCTGLILEAFDLRKLLLVGGIIGAVAVAIYLAIAEGQSNIVRKGGSSTIATSINWFIFTSVKWDIIGGLLTGALNFFILFLISASAESKTKRRYSWW